MFTFLLIVGAAFVLTWALHGAYAFGHAVGFERGKVEHRELELDALAMRKAGELRELGKGER